MIALRPATASDCDRVYEWNFDPEVRAMSLRPELVTIAQHSAWYARRLSNGAGPMWVIEEDRRPVGVVRIDDAGYAGKMSISLGANARGRGIGKDAIRSACRLWQRAVVAEVRAVNRVSRACFEACGFVPVAEHDGLVTYRWGT